MKARLTEQFDENEAVSRPDQRRRRSIFFLCQLVEVQKLTIARYMNMKPEKASPMARVKSDTKTLTRLVARLRA